MAAATRHLNGDAPPAHASRARAQPQLPVVDSSADLVAKARAECERGLDISAFEMATRRPRPQKLGSLRR